MGVLQGHGVQGFQCGKIMRAPSEPNLDLLFLMDVVGRGGRD